MNEIWEKWCPIESLDSKYDIACVIENENGLIIKLNSVKTNQSININFEGGVNTFRWANESYRLNTMSELRQKYGNGYFGYWTFFKVYNSEFLKWFLKESLTSSEKDLTHYCLIGAETFLDIISFYEPKIESADK